MEIKPILLDTNAYTAFQLNVSDAVEIINNALLIVFNWHNLFFQLSVKVL